MNKKSNRWLILFVVVALIVCIPIIFKSNNIKHEALKEVPFSVNPAGDTTADTLATVQAEMEKVEETNQVIIDYNKELTRHREDTKTDVTRIKKQQGVIDKNLRDLNAQKQRDNIQINTMRRQMDDLKNRLAQVSAERSTLNGNGLPTGFGFDDTTGIRNTQTGKWAKPLDAVEDEDSEGSGFGLLNRNRSKTKEQPIKQPSTVPKEAENIRVLTIPNTLTGLDSVALTAMVGRIPVKGSIQDPYPFKLIMGKENIVANGLDLPEVSGMIWAGIAKGDWNLSCVAGELQTVTFVFEDGTIVTHKSDKGVEPLGWISDENGFPCISGEFVTNAPQFLAQRVLLGGLDVAASAYAQAQTSVQSSLLGSESFISGDTGKYVLGETASAATREISAWLLERQQQSFDAVIATPGIPVGIHVTQELQIDYQLKGRKLRHEQIQVSRNDSLP